MLWIYALLVASSLLLSLVLTPVVRTVARRVGFVDKPGHRKIHVNAKPLGGGIAIFLAVVIPMAAGLIFANAIDQMPRWLWQFERHRRGIVQQTWPAVWMLLTTAAMHVMGLIDDRRALGPYSKLVCQLGITTALVLAWGDLRLLTALGPVVSVVLTVLWITAITNAFNFLDSMDGLSAGVGAVATLAFLVTALMIGQLFVAAALALLLGALIGFLVFNFNPASIFMGDSGSLVLGFLLGVLTVRTTFLSGDELWVNAWYKVLAPVIVLAVPLYDLIVVSGIRLSRGRSPFVGDTNHFSHRLVQRGMSRRTAVLCIWLVTAATAIAAVLLPRVRGAADAGLIFAQTLLVLGVVYLLERHPLPRSTGAVAQPGPTPATPQPGSPSPAAAMPPISPAGGGTTADVSPGGQSPGEASSTRPGEALR